jgi:hypothetical protein
MWGQIMTVACIAALVWSWSSAPFYYNKSTTSAEMFAAKLCGAFAAALNEEIFTNEPPVLRLQWAIANPARYLAIKC